MKERLRSVGMREARESRNRLILDHRSGRGNAFLLLRWAVRSVGSCGSARCLLGRGG